MLDREKNRCLFSDPHKTHKYSLCGQNVQLLNVKLAVHIVTTGLIIGKFILAVPNPLNTRNNLNYT